MYATVKLMLRMLNKVKDVLVSQFRKEKVLITFWKKDGLTAFEL